MPESAWRDESLSWPKFIENGWDKVAMSIRTLISLLVLVSVLIPTPRAPALTPFRKAFDEKYVKKSDDARFRRTYRRTGCNTCHIKGKKRDWVNHYGNELAKVIGGNAQARLDEAKEQGAKARKAETEKILKELELAFAKTEKLKTPSGVTYRELFKSHQLPSDEKARSLKEEPSESKSSNKGSARDEPSSTSSSPDREASKEGASEDR